MENLEIYQFIKELLSKSSSYYLKEPKIATKERIKGQTYYSPYKLIDKKPSTNLIELHLKKEITLAIDLSTIDGFYIEFQGEDEKSFFLIINYALKKLNISKVVILPPQYNGVIGAFIITQDKDKLKKFLENKLLEYYPYRVWKILPKYSHPSIANIFILPREIISLKDIS
jgi:hypothetical protein